MLHTVEDLITKINVMHDIAIKLHRERNKYSKLSGVSYNKEYCNHLLDQIQQLALEIARDREGSEIKTAMEYKPETVYKVRIYNSMFGYERDQVVEIIADSEKSALKIAQQKDLYAEVSIVS
jgi:predicted house-cleaning noncanonical NTP pyrophosphatase (MazG superfamily)